MRHCDLHVSGPPGRRTANEIYEMIFQHVSISERGIDMVAKDNQVIFSFLYGSDLKCWMEELTKRYPLLRFEAWATSASTTRHYVAAGTNERAYKELSIFEAMVAKISAMAAEEFCAQFLDIECPQSGREQTDMILFCQHHGLSWINLKLHFQDYQTAMTQFLEPRVQAICEALQPHLVPDLIHDIVHRAFPRKRGRWK